MSSSSSVCKALHSQDSLIDPFSNIIKEKIDSVNDVCLNLLQEKIDSLNIFYSKSLSEKIDSLKDSVLNTFKLSVDSIFSDTNSIFVKNKNIATFWYGYFNDSFDKLMSSYTALIVAVLTVIGAIFILKHWYDNKNFIEKIDEMQNKWKTDLSSIQKESQKIDKKLEEMNEIENKFKQNLDTISSNVAQNEENLWVNNKLIDVKISYEFWSRNKGSKECKELLEKIIESIKSVREHFETSESDLFETSASDRFVKFYVCKLIDDNIIELLYSNINSIKDKLFLASIQEKSILLWKEVNNYKLPEIELKNLEQFVFCLTTNEKADNDIIETNS